MIDITLENFEQDVIAASMSQPVLVDFWAPWCGPCKSLGPVLEKLERDYGGRFALVKVNSDTNPELVSSFCLKSIPYVVAFVDGNAVAQFMGAQPEAYVRAFLDRLIPNPGELEHRSAREALAKAERTRGAVELEPGRYRAVLEPYALADLLYWFSFDTMNGLGFLEERSFFSGRVGERAFDPKLTMVDDALDPRGLPRSFDFEGVPKQRTPLVEEGVIRGPVWDRATAARAGRESTGNGLPASARAYGPVPTNLVLSPGEAESTEELAELVGDGIYVTRVHYLSVVSQREGVITGMTRDGTFRIRDGKVAEPLVNLRFTVALPDVLAELPGLTVETRLVNASDFYDDRWAYGNRVPAIATASFNVTGVGSAPGL